MALLLVLFASGAHRPTWATPGDILIVRAQEVNLREDPSRDSAVRLRLKAGQKLMEFERREGWVRVMVFGAVGMEGWVRRDRVAPEPRESRVPAPSPPRAGPTILPETTAFVASVSGSPALEFRSECHFVDDHGRHTHKVRRGLSPAELTFDALAVSCTVQKFDSRGRLRVTLFRSQEIIASAETAAPFNWVRVRSDGPWGRAGGIRGDIPTSSVLPRVSPRSDRPLGSRIVPPFRSDIVPPLR